MVEWKDHIGKRLLVGLTVVSENIRSVVEVSVLEVSPSGDFVKFKFLCGDGCWEKKDHYELVEELPTVVCDIASLLYNTNTTVEWNYPAMQLEPHWSDNITVEYYDTDGNILGNVHGFKMEIK